MYLYSFDKFAWPDKIFAITKWNTFCKKIKIWDLIKLGEDIFVCLGEDVSFAEQYVYFYTPKMDAVILHKWLLSEKAGKMIHRMVYTYYTTYKSVMKYFVSDEWEKLLEKESKWKGKIEQTLIVYPDLRTIMNTIDEKEFAKKEVAFLNSTSSQWQKDKQRWAIKQWQVSLIYASPSEIFQDFHNLKKIILIDPHKWYYANQQDPRYKVGAVLEEMAKLYGATLEKVGN